MMFAFFPKKVSVFSGLVNCQFLLPEKSPKGFWVLGNNSLSVFPGLKVQPVAPFLSRVMSVTSSLLGFEKIKLLDASDDAYGGVIVDMKEPMDSEVFASLLGASTSQWRQQGKKGIWIKLPIELVNLVEAAVKAGFRYHHAEASYLMLVKWIPKTNSTLPANASHRVGIGACVMNDKGEVLVVQENGGKFKGTGVWKFPTGVVDEIETQFLEVLAFRQSHNSFFGKSDLFFVCMLRPLSFDIQKQDSEIEAATWMPFEDYAAQPFVQKHEQFSYIARICLEKKNNKYTGFCAVPTTTAFSSKKNYLYVNKDLKL
ncbi:MutT/nudix family protein [Actinidia rufa]|uniref:MutT/nudix family protein n=1 Tax=Actinidia rufa TaxID=165716 RepID=A0A7J0GNJ3_9ERIC|nr:MutT/nudix family protein [Actinidia rufa]